ncbi:hypothetical protein AB0I84_06065 [Streptomyces spectabilis]|uniref:hypothetical protein n=1 Tax=Streptomyces spectabilis TaxID=68270 RepID=UPI0033FAE9DA
MDDQPTLNTVLDEIRTERARQDAKFGEQNHPDGTAADFTARAMRDSARVVCESKAARGALTWVDVLDEEYWEARAETDPAKLRAELVQVAAVAVAWIEAIDRRTSASCVKCRTPFDPADARFDGRGRYAETAFCRGCVDRGHESTDAFHSCAVCV